MALEFEGKPAFITDSGDNVTSGATGWNTYILRQVLVEKELKKKILFANICDPVAYQKLAQLEIGAKACLHLGVNHDEMSHSVELDVTVKAKGTLRGYLHHPTMPYMAIRWRCRWTACHWISMWQVPPDHVRRAPVRGGWTGLGRIRCDCGQAGYIFPELKEKAAFSVMSLTQGATPQDTRIIPFKQIMRPMYPIDKI